MKSINKTKKGGKKLVCINQNGHTIELPKDCVAGGFQPMADGKEYYLAEVLKKFSLPLYVRFVEPYTMDQETRSKDKPLYLPAGTICLDRTSTETVITATAIKNGQQKIMQFSPDVDIYLVVCDDTFRKSADYVNNSHSFNKDNDDQNIYTDTTEYIDTTQIMKGLALNVASKSGSEKIKKGVPPLKKLSKPKPAKAPVVPPRSASSKAKSNPAKAIPSKPVLPKPKPDRLRAKPGSPDPNLKPKPKPKAKISTSKHDVKITGNVTSLAYESRHQQTTEEMEQAYTDPNEIYEEIGFTEPKYTKCGFFMNPAYTELDPPNIPTFSHEYAKPHVEHPPAILGCKSQTIPGKKQHAKSNPTSHLGSQLSATSDSNQPAGSNSLLCNRRPPPVPDRLPLSRNRSAIFTNPHLPNNAVAFPNRVLPNVPNNPPQLPSRLKRPHSKTDLSVKHKRKTASTDSQSPTPMVTNSNPALPISQPPSLQANPIQPTSQPPSSIQQTPIQSTSQTPSSTQPTPFTPGQPPSLPTNKMPVPTPEQKEEIYEAISKYPTDLSSLSITDVSALLNYLGMGKYVETFEAELIDGAMLASMDKESLESLNLIPFHVTKLMKFIGGWRPNSKIRLKK